MFYLTNHGTNSLADYALGVETGFDLNGRKNGDYQIDNLIKELIKNQELESIIKNVFS